MLKISGRAIAATGAVLLMLSSPVQADDENSGWWGRGWSMGMGMGMGRMMGFEQDALLSRIDGRLAFLKTELKITDAQTEAWENMAKTIRVTSESHNDMMREHMKEMQDGEFFKKPLPERLTYQEVHLEARLEQIKQVKDAVEKLYTVLSDDQKKSADEIVLPMMGMGRGRHMMMQ
jgi:hypothetical protein